MITRTISKCVLNGWRDEGFVEITDAVLGQECLYLDRSTLFKKKDEVY